MTGCGNPSRNGSPASKKSGRNAIRTSWNATTASRKNWRRAASGVRSANCPMNWAAAPTWGRRSNGAAQSGRTAACRRLTRSCSNGYREPKGSRSGTDCSGRWATRPTHRRDSWLRLDRHYRCRRRHHPRRRVRRPRHKPGRRPPRCRTLVRFRRRRLWLRVGRVCLKTRKRTRSGGGSTRSAHRSGCRRRCSGEGREYEPMPMLNGVEMSWGDYNAAVNNSRELRDLPRDPSGAVDTSGNNSDDNQSTPPPTAAPSGPVLRIQPYVDPNRQFNFVRLPDGTVHYINADGSPGAHVTDPAAITGPILQGVAGADGGAGQKTR